jgi:hypothetical protein
MRVAGINGPEGNGGLESTVLADYAYVVDMRAFYDSTHGAKGAFIVSTSSSFGIAEGGAHPADYPVWCAMYDTLGYYGILSAAAAPDAPVDVDVVSDMPTGCPSKWLITVTNTTNTDQLNPSAAWGDTTEALGAPGTGIYSTITGNSYGRMTGTSQSTPHVAGAVAAMYAAACPQLIADYFTRPDSVALIIKKMLLSGTTRLSDLYNVTETGGRLNLYNAIKNLDEYNCNKCNFSTSLSLAQPTCSDSCNGVAQLRVNGTSNYLRSWSSDSTGGGALRNLCPGIYSVTVTDTASGCQETQNFTIYKPDSIVINSINIIPVSGPDSGNIIVNAHAGNYHLGYSLNGVNYQPTSTLIISANGVYNVYITNNIGCVIQRTFDVTGISEVANFGECSIYPNPVNERLNISLNLSGKSEIQFSVFSVIGEKIIEESKNIPAGLSSTLCDISSLASGIYFLNVTDRHSSVIR